jgi:hypothetical protein
LGSAWDSGHHRRELRDLGNRSCPGARSPQSGWPGLRSQSIGFSADYGIQFTVVYINIVYQDDWIPIYFGRTKPRIAAISKGRNRPYEDAIIRIEDDYRRG